ncbi:MAG: type II toxin-antitoxin system PemK/MazF family toxin [Armatimonadota bacterium]|nr:type II toxin-antitoxin system PemK/MazF family toxin [Armatimonadota bacterium]
MADFPRQGEIFFARLPEETKERPTLVVSINARNQFGNSILVVPLTTNPRPAPTHVSLSAGEGGLPLASVARCENVTTLPKSLLTRGPLGVALSTVRMKEIVLAVVRAMGGLS